MTITPDYRMHPAKQFLLFWAIVIVTMFIGTVIGLAFIKVLYGQGPFNEVKTGVIESPQAHNALWILQLTGMTLPLFLSAVFFAYVVMRDQDNYLKPHFEFNPLLLLVALLIMVVSMPVMEWVGNINQQINVPQAMRDWEAEADKQTEMILNMPTVASLISTILFVGLLTAIVEEFLFRGVLQTILQRWTGSIHAAVWISAALFSAFHFEFLGFFPRLFLGVFFGYFVAWSGSVWTGVWAHFLNNSIDILLNYLAKHRLIMVDTNDEHAFQHILGSWAYIISAIFTVLLLLAYKYVSRPKLTYQD